MPLRILFAGTPEFAVPALEALAASGHTLVGVLTQPDRPAGRGLRQQASPVKQRALAPSVPVFQPTTLRDEGIQAVLSSKAADIFVVAAYGLLLPAPLLGLPRLGCVNIHASLLPRWRGAAPIQRAILAGDQQTGVSIMRMEAGLDTGAVYLRRVTPIGPTETATTLHDRLAVLGAKALLDALPSIADGSLRAVPQDDAQATYAKRIEKREGRLDWTRPADQLERQVRAFNPWPVCETSWAGTSLRIWDARALAQSEKSKPGVVLAATREGIDVATGDGVLRLLHVQRAGKSVVSASDFAHAHALVGAELG